MYKCPICLENILNNQDKFMLAFEVPYLNMYIHREHGLVGINLQELVETYLNNLIITKNNKKMV